MQALLKNPLSSTWVGQIWVYLMIFSLAEMFTSIYSSSISFLRKKPNQMIGTCNSLVAQPLGDHLAGISLCWDNGDYSVSVAFQEPIMSSMIKCK